MSLFSETPCPKCGGPVTFFDVMGIITPFQSVSCVSCGESIFLKYRWRVLLFSVFVTVAVLAGSVMAVVWGLATTFEVFLGAAGVMILLEFLVTGYIIRKKHLTVRRRGR